MESEYIILYLVLILIEYPWEDRGKIEERRILFQVRDGLALPILSFKEFL